MKNNFSTCVKHLKSPAGDERYRSVPCGQCGQRTLNICARCDAHCGHAPGPAVVTTPGSAPAPTLLGRPT
jgi:hypothetical protein